MQRTLSIIGLIILTALIVLFARAIAWEECVHAPRPLP